MKEDDAPIFDYYDHLTRNHIERCGTPETRISTLFAGQSFMCPGLNDVTVLETVKDCGSLWLCSLTPAFRKSVLRSLWYNNWTARHIPGTDIPLLMPIQKVSGYPRAESALIEPPADGGEPVFPPWPERLDVLKLNLHRFRDGPSFETCRKYQTTKIHWFCTHLSPNYGSDHRHAVALMRRANVFERHDVRLVLDLAGSVGAFAEALHSCAFDGVATSEPT